MRKPNIVTVKTFHFFTSPQIDVRIRGELMKGKERKGNFNFGRAAFDSAKDSMMDVERAHHPHRGMIMQVCYDEYHEIRDIPGEGGRLFEMG
jgi:hypothetical protein